MSFIVKLLSLLMLAIYSNAKLQAQPEEDFVQCANGGEPKCFDFTKLKTEPYNDTFFFLTGNFLSKI